MHSVGRVASVLLFTSTCVYAQAPLSINFGSSSAQLSGQSPADADRIAYAKDGTQILLYADAYSTNLQRLRSLEIAINIGTNLVREVHVGPIQGSSASTLLANCPPGSIKTCNLLRVNASVENGPIIVKATSTGVSKVARFPAWSRTITLTIIPVSYFGSGSTVATSCAGAGVVGSVQAQPIFVFKNDVRKLNSISFYARYSYVGPNPASPGQPKCSNSLSVSAYLGPFDTSTHEPDQFTDTKPFAQLPGIGIWDIELTAVLPSVTVRCRRPIESGGSGQAHLREDNPSSQYPPETGIGGNCL